MQLINEDTIAHKRLILKHMESNGQITQAEAFRFYGCWRLSARIYDLRQDGHNIEMSLSKGRKKYGIYTLKPKNNEQPSASN